MVLAYPWISSALPPSVAIRSCALPLKRWAWTVSALVS